MYVESKYPLSVPSKHVRTDAKSYMVWLRWSMYTTTLVEYDSPDG